jgi:transposase
VQEQDTTPAGQAGGRGIIVPLGLEGLRVLSQRVGRDGELEVTVMGTQTRAACPRCGRVSAKQHDVRSRCKQDVACGARRVVLVLRKRRFRCLSCRRPFTEPDTACGWRRRTTVRRREQIGQQALGRPLSHVAAEYGVGPRFVQDCWAEAVAAQFVENGRPLDETAPLPTPRFLGLDEFARRKGQRYDTILCDLGEVGDGGAVAGRRVVEIAAGRAQEPVTRLLERLDAPEQVAAVAMDMSGSFRAAVELCLPRAVIVADHFHVVQHVGKALARVFGRCAATSAGRSALKGQRHLFVRAGEALSDEEAAARAALADQFPELAVAWTAKEHLRTWYATATAQDAAAGLDAGVAAIEQDGPDELRQALAAFRTWRAAILAFFTFLPLRLSNGFVEGKNNRTKALMRQAYGYRNRHHLRWRILTQAT